jgi:hypothetical protein
MVSMGRSVLYCVSVYYKITKFYIVSDQKSEAVNVKYFSELHARSDLRFIIKLREEVSIVPASS